jgi:ABC-type multidrug transport system fused ATPase/permease subunit
MLKDSKKIFEIFKLAKLAFWEYRPQILVMTILGFLSGILGGVGVNAIIPLFSFMSGNSGPGDDLISRYIKVLFNFSHIPFTVKYLLIFIVLLFVLKAAVSIFSSYVNVRITSGYEQRTRSRLFAATLKAGWPYLLKQKIGHLEKILMVNVQNSCGLLSQISSGVMILTGLITYALVAINISFPITVVTCICGALLFFIFKPLIRKVRHISYEWEEINRDIAHHVNENILGIKVVKVMNAGNKVAELGSQYFSRIRQINIKSYLIGVFSSSLIEPISVFFIAAMFIFSYKYLSFSLAALITVMYLIKQIFLYITQIQAQVMSMNANVPYLKSILEYEKQITDFAEKENGSKDFLFSDKVEFRNVSFSYDAKKETLKGVNFKIKKGEMVGLIGPSGSGKTTIVDLMLRLFDPTSGEILLDGVNASKIKLKDWRRNIGYVSQDIFLMNDTIANNIKFYDDSIGQKEIEEAAKMANIYEFIMSCPNGFEAVVGERGVLLSGGQRQRLIIARVLARKPQLLILDEATSALDNESEIKIQQVINGLKNKVTVLAIAHRLSTVINSDKLIVLENGRITEVGGPEELLKDKKSYFSKVYNLRE